MSSHTQQRESIVLKLILVHGRWNRSGTPGDHHTNVCSMVPERLADAISEVLIQKISALRTDNQLLGRRVSLITELKHMK